MLHYELKKIEEKDGQKIAVVEYDKKQYSVDCCGHCPFINYVADFGDCDLTDEVFKGDIWNEYGEKCPFFSSDEK